MPSESQRRRKPVPPKLTEVDITYKKVPKCMMKLEIAKLKEEIKEIECKILELKKQKTAYEVKIELMMDHLKRSGYQPSESLSVDSEDSLRTDSEDSLRTSELLELSLSSTLDSSLLGYSSEMEDSMDDAEGDKKRSQKPSNEFRLMMPEGDTD